MEWGPEFSKDGEKRKQIYIYNNKYVAHDYTRHYASAQYVCDISYALAKEKMLPAKVNVLNKDGSYTIHLVQQLTLKPGLFAYFLIPENTAELAEIKLVFRGTDFSDLDSAFINLEYGGPGVQSFYEVKEAIFAQLTAVKNIHFPGISVPLRIYGHSQGAAMGQLVTIGFLVEHYHTSLFDNITEIDMTVLNSPGIPPHFAKLSQQYATLALEKELKIQAHFGMIHGDAIQLSGLDMAFMDLPWEIAQVNLLILNTGLKEYYFREVDASDGIDWKEYLSILKNAIKAMIGGTDLLGGYKSVLSISDKNPLPHPQHREKSIVYLEQVGEKIIAHYHDGKLWRLSHKNKADFMKKIKILQNEWHESDQEADKIHIITSFFDCRIMGAHSGKNFYAPELNTDGKILGNRMLQLEDKLEYFSNKNPDDIVYMQKELLNKLAISHKLYFVQEAFMNLDIGYIVVPAIKVLTYQFAPLMKAAFQVITGQTPNETESMTSKEKECCEEQNLIEDLANLHIGSKNR